MHGGILRGASRWGELPAAYVALATLLLTPIVSPHVVNADDFYVSEDRVLQVVPEQSIVVATGKAARDDLPATADNSLEPIAVASDYVSDLADQVLVAERVVEVTDRLASAAKVAAEEPEPIESEVLSFHGITPGISTRINVLRAWGDPRSEETTAAELKYRFGKLKFVYVQFDGDVVDAIVVELPKSLPTHRLVSNLGMKNIRSTLLTDSAGVPLARTYPERGVVLCFADRQSADADRDPLSVASDPTSEHGLTIGKIILQPIKAASFLLRGENEATSDLSLSIRDLEEALKLDRNSAHAKWLLSNISLKIGKAVTAERQAAEAIEIDPGNSLYRLQHAKCLRHLARYDLAAEEAKKVLESPTIDQIVRAKALHEMGILASLGSAKVAERTVPLITKAIEIADQHATDDDMRVRLEANKLLVVAHLDMAVFISKGKWVQKDQTVPEWIERASALSEEIIARDKRHLSLRLQVAISGLAAAANVEPPIDPQLWIEEAEQTAATLREATDDLLLWGVYDWSLGLAYFQAAQIEHRRNQPDRALRLLALAEAKLTEVAKHRDELPDTSYLMGRLYFQTGAVHAIHFEDHTKACAWYDRAAHLLLNPVPVTTMAGPQQHGDALVSMGVSYWHERNRQRAIELTLSGVDLIEQAVEKGILNSDSLAVPYGNLAAMYEAQGQRGPAAKYTRLAKQLKDQTTQQRR
ncbi:MAG: hypothetical protein IH831_09355 [Planctomycetes bacterium]|nr:hypothetical protein [Planctomycetota bacterium]